MKKNSNNGKDISTLLKNKVELSIVIPVFNEEKNIQLIVDRYLKLDKDNFEVIFVEDGGSKDNTRKELEKFAKKYSFVNPLFTNEPGYGASIYNGLKKANGEYICWTHGDIQTPPEDTIKALEIIKVEKNAKQCYIKGDRYGRPFLDQFFTFGMSVIETALFKKKFWDINAQPNLVHKSFLKLMKNPPKDFSFDLYTYYIAQKNNFKMIRFSVHFGERIYGESAWNDGMKARIKFIKRTLKFSFELKRNLK